MITDAGFEIVSDFSAEALVDQAETTATEHPVEIAGKSAIKTLEDLRPAR